MGKTGVYKANNKLHDEDELPENLKGKNDTENLSKSAAKNKKRREAAKKKKDEEENNPANPGDKTSSPAPDNATTGDPEKDKKIRKINDKLAQISKLKQQVKDGKQLEANQLSILESTRKDTSEASIELEEDEICALVEKTGIENVAGQHQQEQ